MKQAEIANRRVYGHAMVVLAFSTIVTVCLSGQESRQKVSSGESHVIGPSGSPISFEPNQGQADDQVRFMARGPGYSLYLSGDGATFSFESDSRATAAKRFLALKFLGGRNAPRLTAKDELSTKSSYFVGPNPKNWHTGIPNFARVAAENVYPGIDVMYQGTHGRLECHFLVSPGGNPDTISMAISGAQDPRLDAEGNLTLRAGPTEIRLNKPSAYQNVGGQRQAVAARYVVRGSRITVAAENYDRTNTLVIDPVLNYTAYLKAEDAVLTAQPRLPEHD